MSEVCLSVFRGPLDLLVLLARRFEVDPLEVDVASVAEQAVGDLNNDLCESGRKLQQVATLVRFKSFLLSRPRRERSHHFFDPAEEMTGHLEEFRLLQERVSCFERMMERASNRYGRAMARNEDGYEIEDLSVFDLAAVFADLLSQIETPQTVIEIETDHRSVDDYLTELMALLKETAVLQHLTKGKKRSEQVGYFLALLEGGIRSVLRVVQMAPYGPIFVTRLNKERTR